MDVGLAKPKRPGPAVKQRADLERYDAEMSAYEHQAETVRRKAVDLAMRQGWVLSTTSTTRSARWRKTGISLKEDMGQMVYGMDVDRERHKAQQIAFLPRGQPRRRPPRHRAAHRPELAEMKMLKGDLDGAARSPTSSLPIPTATTPRPTTSWRAST